jgi:hypothetical protein
MQLKADGRGPTGGRQRRGQVAQMSLFPGRSYGDVSPLSVAPSHAGSRRSPTAGAGLRGDGAR